MQHTFSANKLQLTVINSHQEKSIRRTFANLVENIDDAKLQSFLAALKTLTGDNVTDVQLSTVSKISE